jgi:hypothetical protein
LRYINNRLYTSFTLKSRIGAGIREQSGKAFPKKTVKPITDFNAKRYKGGGFRGNTFLLKTKETVLIGTVSW